MEESQISKNSIKRGKKKKATVNGSSKIKNIPLNQSHHKRSNSESMKRVPNKSLLESASVINLITKGPSINKLFFKNDNISLKSESMPKANKKQVKKFRSINICKDKNEIYNNLMLKKQNNKVSKNSNSNVNYINMDCYEKIHNLRGVAKDYITNNDIKGESNVRKTRKPNFISKNYISNDKLMNFNNSLNKNHPIYDFYQPLTEKEMLKKPLQKIQSLNQEKRKYKFSDFKVIKDVHEADNDESLEDINPDEYREGNIEFITGSSLSDDNEISSSLSSNGENDSKNMDKDKKQRKKEKKN
jgi:hypothetical protein